MASPLRTWSSTMVALALIMVQCCSGAYDFSRFQPWSYMEAHLRSLSTDARYKDRVTLTTMGQTYENRSLYSVKISGGPNARYSVWLDGGMHAREWIASHTAFYVIKQVLSDPTLTNDVDWHISPNINPDGYVFTWEGEGEKARYWRKNRSKEACALYFGRLHCCRGVDLNRNFNWVWGDDVLHTTGNPCLSYYHGDGPFSEPETNAMRNFVHNHRHNLQVHVSLHSYGQLILLPYAYSDAVKPAGFRRMLALGDRVAEAISTYRGTQYTVGSASIIARAKAPGSQLDWVVEQGIPYVYSIELPPSGIHSVQGFEVPSREIPYIIEEAWRGIKVMMRGATTGLLYDMLYWLDKLGV